MLLAQITTSLLGILLTAVVTYFFSQRRYTFEKLHDKKLNSIEEIYSRIISIEGDLNQYVHTIGSMVAPEYLQRRLSEIKPIQDKFFELQRYFWKKEIILDQKSVDVIKSFITISIKIFGDLTVSNISLQLGDNNSTYDKWDKAYKTMSEELQKAKEELKNDFKRTLGN